jgi:O-acetyl-ADP-ribose deacetylase (regulator of RNase III)
MLQFTQGNLLKADAEALVNTVNTVGVMGKGIALQFKQAFPGNFKVYQQACKEGRVHLGKVHVYDRGTLENPRWIINFPTKQHWRSRSHIDDIESGLRSLRREIENLDIRSIAIPPLGCGNGGLKWEIVRPAIIRALEDLPEVDIRVFEPAGAPPESSMVVATPRPPMTRGRAALLVMAGLYDELGLGVSHIELQKLMYLLQEAGETLQLRYAKGYYGPYADNLNHVLERIEGHFIRGFGDRTRSPESAGLLSLDTEAVRQAREYLEPEVDVLNRIEEVLRLVRGFESPYGLELLATLHWLTVHEGLSVSDTDELPDHLASWSRRKGRIFRSTHIAAAWERLRDYGWAKQLVDA